MPMKQGLFLVNNKNIKQLCFPSRKPATLYERRLDCILDHIEIELFVLKIEDETVVSISFQCHGTTVIIAMRI
jgi:hypothetical protein